MKYLISCVGDTDPIRNFRDGSILHIARVERPQVIVLIHSQRTISKHDDIIKAINSLDENYRPTVKKDENIIENVAYFDEVFNQLSTIVRKYLQDNIDSNYEYILNLSSGTPQMKSAFFAINQIETYNIRTIQVATPEFDSNVGVKHEIREDLEMLIEMNLDNQENFLNRCHEDKAEKFAQTLVKQSMRMLIEKYDYYAALQLISEQKSFPNKKQLKRELQLIVDIIKTQDIPPLISKLKYSVALKKSLHGYLLLDMKMKTGDLAEVLIRVKSLAEFIIETYLKKNYSGIFKKLQNDSRIYLNSKNYPNVEQFLRNRVEATGRKYNETYLNLLSYTDILEFLEPKSEMITHLNRIKQINGMRNSVAHNLDKIQSWNDREIKNAVSSTKELLVHTFKFDYRFFNYYNDFNDNLFSLL